MSRQSAVSPASFATFGDLLKHLRKQAGLTQLELSIAVGYSDTQISRMEQNQRVPDAATLTARFVPALHLEHEPQWLKRLLDLAADANHAVEPTLTATVYTSALSRHNLPLKLTSFIGREQQVTDVQRLLSTTRLVTLTGPGGTGKTRLALQAAAVLDQFHDGVWLVELAPIADPALVPQAVAQVLALRAETAESFETPLVDALSLLVNHLRGKTALLLLDNCEHLVGTCAELTEQLLQAAPGLRILATSREALSVGGEKIYPVPALSVPEAGDLIPLEVVAESEAVQLFVERATAVRPDFALADANAASVVQICRRLDGVPLAVELAAARAQALSVEQIAALLEDRFHLLTGGSRTAPPRQQTLRGAIDWSYELLTDEERTLFRRLSVFVRGWPLEAAAPVMGRLGVLDWLTQLVAKSLVLSDQPPGQVARFRMLETIREYAQEKLIQAGEEEDARRRHLAFYVSLAEQAEPELRGKAQVTWLNRLDQENDNLRAALAWAVKTRDAEAALRLADALTYFWVLRGNEGEGRRWLEAALDLQTTSRGTLAPNVPYARALLNAVWLDRDLQKPWSAIQPELEKGFAMSQELGDKPGMALGLFFIGLKLFDQADYAKAVGHYQQALDLWMDAEDGWSVGICWRFLGNAMRRMGDHSKAGEYFQRSVEILSQEGDVFFLASSLSDLAGYYFWVGDIARARALLEEKLAALNQPGAGLNIALNNLTYMLILLGDYANARVTALDMQNSPESLTVVAGWVYLGQIEYLQGRPAEARPHFEAAIKICRDLNDEFATLLATNWVKPWLACVMYRLGNLERAKTLLHESVRNSPNQDHSEIRHALLVRGDVAWAEGDAMAAAEYYARSLRVVKTQGNSDVAARLESFAKLAVTAQQPQRAARLLGAAAALREQMRTPIPPVDRADYDDVMASARAQLDPASFEVAWAEGRALSWEQAAAYALNEIEI